MEHQEAVMESSVTIVNPLGGALRHYTDALVEVLESAGATVHRYDVEEPSVAGTGRLTWLRQHIAALRRARSDQSSRIIVTWPLLGYLDILLLRLLRLDVARVALVVHDPEPLVRSVGMDRISIALARALTGRSALVVHGTEAAEVVAGHGFTRRVRHLPHPVRRRSEVAARPERDRHIVRVLGSWKTDRDVEVLEALGSRLGSTMNLELHGRGWPAVPGWDVHDGFVSEGRFDDLVASAAVVLVPYRRVFQSGVAVRAVELGTPFVGPCVSAHQDLYPDLPSLLVDGATPLAPRVASWVAAVEAAVRVDSATLTKTTEAAVDRAREAWTDMVVGRTS